MTSKRRSRLQEAQSKSADERVRGVRISNDTLAVDLMDGRTISVPILWFPRLSNATPAQRARWRIAGAGFGIQWPEIDEDISTSGLLRGNVPRIREQELDRRDAPSPRQKPQPAGKRRRG
jgi:hypothetical protein